MKSSQKSMGKTMAYIFLSCLDFNVPESLRSGMSMALRDIFCGFGPFYNYLIVWNFYVSL